jgi:hypothetical protein
VNANFRRPAGRLTAFLAVVVGLMLGSSAAAEEAQAPAAVASASGGVSAEQMAKANNPLADMNALSLQDSFVPTINGAPDDHINTMYVRPVMVSGKQIIRATIPISTTPLGDGTYASGLGDINVFDAIKVTGKDAKTDLAVGPLLVLPTASNDALGQGKWQVGAAGVAIHVMPGGSVLGALVTYQTSFAGDGDRPSTSILAAQPIVTLSMGGGYYFRSSANWVFDLNHDRALVPFGVGMGRVFKGLGGVVNVFIEPQFTVYAKGAGQPALQLYTGLNMQWGK